MHINLISYLPTGERSNTLKLQQHILSQLDGKHTIDIVDLLEHPPKMFDHAAMSAYWARNFGGQDVPKELSDAIAPMDELTERLKKADVVILCHPMHNFSYPGPVKVWIDAVMQFGETFTFTDEGPKGLLTDCKSLTCYTCYGNYSEGGGREWQNTIPPLAKIEFEYLGMPDVRTVGASVGNPVTLEENIQTAKNEIDGTLKAWDLV